MWIIELVRLLKNLRHILCSELGNGQKIVFHLTINQFKRIIWLKERHYHQEFLIGPADGQKTRKLGGRMTEPLMVTVRRPKNHEIRATEDAQNKKGKQSNG